MPAQAHLHLTVQNENFESDDPLFNGSNSTTVVEKTISPIHAFWKANNVIHEPNFPVASVTTNTDPNGKTVVSIS